MQARRQVRPVGPEADADTTLTRKLWDARDALGRGIALEALCSEAASPSARRDAGASERSCRGATCDARAAGKNRGWTWGSGGAEARRNGAMEGGVQAGIRGREPGEEPREGDGRTGEGRGRERTRERTPRRPRVCGFRVQSERPERACAHGSACSAVESGRCAAQRGIVGVAWGARGGCCQIGSGRESGSGSGRRGSGTTGDEQERAASDATCCRRSAQFSRGQAGP